MTMIENLLNGKVGEEVVVRPDYLIINDGSGYEVADILQSESLKYHKKGVIVIDHDVPAGNSESSAIFEKLVKFSKKYDIRFIQAKGATYAVMLEEFVKPNQIIVSASTHNAIYGAMGALGLHVDSQTLANLFEHDQFQFQIPETIQIELTGKLDKKVSAIDLWITLFGSMDQVLANKAIEFVGDGAINLSQHDKVVLCSMASRRGAVTAFINEEKKWQDKNVITIPFALEKVVPVIALPVTKEESLAGQLPYEAIAQSRHFSFDVGFIGGYTGGYIEDLRVAAKLMKGKHLDLGFRLNICPVSSKVYLQALEEGLITNFIDFGAQILAPSDHNIVLQGAGVIGSKERALTTGSYNFNGCLGSDDSLVYIGSVESVVKAALKEQLQIA